MLGNQLFPLENMQAAEAGAVFMAEDLGLCTYEKHHKLKILLFLSSMRSYSDELKAKKFNVNFIFFDAGDINQSYVAGQLLLFSKHQLILGCLPRLS